MAASLCIEGAKTEGSWKFQTSSQCDRLDTPGFMEISTVAGCTVFHSFQSVFTNAVPDTSVLTEDTVCVSISFFSLLQFGESFLPD